MLNQHSKVWALRPGDKISGLWGAVSMYDIDLKFTEDVHQQVYLTSDAAPLQKFGAC